MKSMAKSACGLAGILLGVLALTNSVNRTSAGPPEYEPAYVNGKTVTINVLYFNPRQTKLPAQAQADFYLVIYPWQPVSWKDLGVPPPICNPCDHNGDGDTPDDYHDHVLDSIPANPGHGEWRSLWHVFLVLPAYTGNPDHDLLVTVFYAAQLPATSEAAVDDLVSSTLPDGSPVAAEIDLDFYFLCAVVNPHAGGR